MRIQGGLSNIQFGWESNSLEIGSLARRQVSTKYAMDKLVLSKIPKENYQMIKIHYNSSLHIFITLLKSSNIEFPPIDFLQLIIDV